LAALNSIHYCSDVQTYQKRTGRKDSYCLSRGFGRRGILCISPASGKSSRSFYWWRSFYPLSLIYLPFFGSIPGSHFSWTIYGGLAFLFKKDQAFGSFWGYLLLGLAGLTRYEVWLLLPILFFVSLKKILKTKKGISLLVATFLLFFALGWGPIFWMILNKFHWGSFTAFLFHKKGAVYVWQPHVNPVEILTYLGRMAFWIFKYGSPVVLFSVLGWYVYSRQQPKVLLPLRLVIMLSVFVLLMLTFFVGPEFARAHRFASIPLSLVLIYSAFGLEYVFRFLDQKRHSFLKFPKLTPALSISGIILLMFYSAIPVARAVKRPEPAVTYQVARFLDNHLQQDEKAVVVAEGFREHPAVPPMPYQRIGAQSNLSSKQVLSASLIKLETRETFVPFARKQNLKYVVMYSNFEPWLPSDKFFMEVARSENASLQKVFEDSTAIYLIEKW
jgi:hypothetical protein